jgi:superfamily II DNA/RNA helicase
LLFAFFEDLLMSQTNFSSFNFCSELAKGIEVCGYTTPTPIQLRSIPPILDGQDLVASAQTGTGKTAAFVLPALHKLSLSKPNNKPRILILTPTRELAAQITQAAAQYGKFMRFNIISLVGGMPYRQQLKDLSRQVDIIVATPGRLLDHMQSRKVDLSQIEMLVLDEADRMLDMGFIDDVKVIAKATPKARQTLLFSATVDNKLATIIRDLLRDPIRIDIAAQKDKPALIKQELYITDNVQHKERLLQHFLDNGNIYKGIIFSGTKINADYLANQLINKGYAAAPLHGDLKQNVRNRTVESLRRGKIQFLIATDVAARGIDISDVTHVINYDLPKFSEDYVHRIGRTGRAGKTGVAISFALPMDAKHLQKIERYTGQKIQVETVPGLEPTKRMSMSAAASSGDTRRRRGSGGGYKGSSNSTGSYKSSKKTFGEKKSFAEKKSFSDKKSFTEKKSFGDKKSFAEKRSFGERNNYSTNKSYADKDSYNSRKSFGDKSSYSPRKSSDDSLGTKKSYSNKESFGEKRSFNDKKSFSAKGRINKHNESSFSEKRSTNKRAPSRFANDKSDMPRARGNRFSNPASTQSTKPSMEKLALKRTSSSKLTNTVDKTQGGSARFSSAKTYSKKSRLVEATSAKPKTARFENNKPARTSFKPKSGSVRSSNRKDF